jgi:hypothetical protein
MSYVIKEPIVKIEKKIILGEKYIYIYEDDINLDKNLNSNNIYDKITWTLMPIKGLWITKKKLTLTIGNKYNQIFALSGYDKYMVDKWYDQIFNLIQNEA